MYRLSAISSSFSEGRPGRHWSARILGALVALAVGSASLAVAANPVQTENARQGTSAWQLSNPATNREIEGYASLTSVNRGGFIDFFVNTGDSSLTIRIFRVGWYSGRGGREVASPVQLTAKGKGKGKGSFQQPSPVIDSRTNLIECNWQSTYRLTVPSTGWTSGIYLATLTAGTSGKQAYIIFVVRDDSSTAALLYQQSVTTYQAYNGWGGASLYPFNSPLGRAAKVSFNRPYDVNLTAPGASEFGNGAGEFLVNFHPDSYPTSRAAWEINMVRFLEREGYDVTYCTDIDTHTTPGLLTKHLAFLSVGHDEYWSYEMRSNVEAAGQQGVDLAFFGADACYWQVRFEPSPLTGAANRTMVCYKYSYDPSPYNLYNPHDSADPYAQDGDPSNDGRITVRWRDLGRPENALIGVMYVGDPVDANLVIVNAGSWVCQGTGLANGSSIPGMVGYEVDSVWDGLSGVPGNGMTPAGLQRIAQSPFTSGQGSGYSDATIYTLPSGANVFATGSMQWSWGLDDYNAPALRTQRSDASIQQMTRNVLNSFGSPG